MLSFGAIIGFYILYAIIAAISKHEIGLIIAGIIGVIAGIFAGVARGDYITLIGSIIGVLLVAFTVPIQIKSKKKDEWKNKIVQNKSDAQTTTQNKEDK